MTPQRAHTAAALLIGNELLSGKIQEANLLELARTLRAVGVKLSRAAVVPDIEDEIAGEVSELSRRFDVVFTSGGVGPTHDDVTIAAIARAFGTRAVIDPTMRQLIQTAYGERCTDSHLRMALIPEGADLATTEDISWPTVVMKNVWVLPGVPEVFRMKLAVVRRWVVGPSPLESRAVFVKIEEAELKDLLDQVVATHPSVEVGSYPKWFDAAYKTKVTFDGASGAAVTAAMQDFVARLPEGEPQRIE